MMDLAIGLMGAAVAAYVLTLASMAILATWRAVQAWRERRAFYARSRARRAAARAALADWRGRLLP